ncbi:MAG TPA: hypothetical protein VHG93_10505 [Longimicrobium sp.]|nr:hypothetical protein [Longimicrobium sp.]
MPKHLRVFAALVACALAACGTDSTQPSRLIPTGGPALGLFDPPVVVDVLQRSQPLLHNFSATGVIGRGGGVLRIPEAGFSITFPLNAVREPTTITVTALEGSAVAYTFEPHGLVFNKAPVISQDLRGTEVFRNPTLLLGLEGVYFLDESHLSGLTAIIRETRPALVDLLSWRMRFDVQHFSGYSVSTRRGGYINSSGNLIPFER